MVVFKDRKQAGQKLAQEIENQHYPHPLVIAIPRGGVPIGKEVATKLHAPIDIIVVKKIGYPHQPELALCVVAESRTMYCQQKLLSNIDSDWLEQAKNTAYNDVVNKKKLLSISHSAQTFKDSSVVLVDDGVATGLSMIAAIHEIKKGYPKSLIVASPVISKPAYLTISKLVGRVHALLIPTSFSSVGAYYHHFKQLSDADVISFLRVR